VITLQAQSQYASGNQNTNIEQIVFSDLTLDYLREIVAACTEVLEGKRPSRAIDDIGPGCRKVSIKAHVPFFRATTEGDTEVIRILHQRMDVERHFR
jgi:toxin ParE1/3/4